MMLWVSQTVWNWQWITSMNLQGNGYGMTRSTNTVVAKADQGRLWKPVCISSLWVKYEEGV